MLRKMLVKNFIATALLALGLSANADVALTFDHIEKSPAELRMFYTVQVKDGLATMTTSTFAGNRMVLREDSSMLLLDSVAKLYSSVALNLEKRPSQKIPASAETDQVAGVACKKLAVHVDGKHVGQRCVANAQDLGINPDDFATLHKFMVAMQIINESTDVYDLAPMYADGSIAIAYDVSLETVTREIRLKKISRATQSQSDFVIPAHYKPVTDDNPESIDYLAETGDREAKFRAANQYRLGDVVERDIERALKWYRLAAEQDHIGAARELGRLYLGYKDVPADYKLARRWFSKAAAAGDSESLYGMAMLYRNGLGVEKNAKQSMEWLLKAAHAGEVQAQFDAAYLLEHGRGTDVDMSAAVRWYEEAARGGNHYAMMRLGELFRLGENGTRKDIDKAIDFYEQAVNAGSLGSANLLTWIYGGGGDTMPPDTAKVLYFAQVALALAADDSVKSQSAEMADIEALYEHTRGIASTAQKALADDLFRKWQWRAP